MIHDKFTPLTVHAKYDEQKGKMRYYVYDWPERVALLKKKFFHPLADVIASKDDNIVDFAVDNGIARYYIIKGMETELFIYAKKFYHITYEVK